MRKTYAFNLHRGQVSGWCAALRSNGAGLLPDIGACPVFSASIDPGRMCSRCPSVADPTRGSRYVNGRLTFNDGEALRAALERLYGNVITGASNGVSNDVVSGGYAGQTVNCAMYVPQANCGASFGNLCFVREGDVYRMVVDDMGYRGCASTAGLRPGTKDQFEEGMLQEVAVDQLRIRMGAQGYTVDVQRVDGEIRVTASHSGSGDGDEGYAASGWSV